MSNGRKIIPGEGAGFFLGIAQHLKLVWRLMLDQRVSPLLKLIPIGTLVYLISPIDIPTPLDDAAIIGLGTYIFIELCPPAVVNEHRAAIEHTIPARFQDADKPEIKEEDIIDVEYKEL